MEGLSLTCAMLSIELLAGVKALLEEAGEVMLLLLWNAIPALLAGMFGELVGTFPELFAVDSTELLDVAVSFGFVAILPLLAKSPGISIEGILSGI